MLIFKLCCVALLTGVCALVLKSHKSELVPLCLTAGGIIMLLYAFDGVAASISFIKEFAEQTGIDGSVIRIIFKVIGVGYLIELTASSVKDLGFESLADKLILCGKLTVFIMTIPILTAMYKVIISLVNLV